MIKVRYVGTFAVGELLVFASTPFVGWRAFLANPGMRRLLGLAFLWLVGVLVSDVYNQTPLLDALKGCFNVLFLIALMPFSYWILSDSLHRILYFWGGYSLSALVNFFFFFAPTLESRFDFEVWRVYAFWPLFAFLASFLYYKGWRKTGMVVAQGFAFWTLFQSSRNVFLCMTVATAVLLYLAMSEGRETVERMALYGRKRFLLFVVGVLAIVFAAFFYERGAERGVFGEAVQNKYLMQKHADIGLASGRVDFVMSLLLIRDNPLVGYGSYAKDKDGFRDRYLYEHGYAVRKAKGEELLPGHSYILGAWVYAGVLGVFFFVFALRQIWSMLSGGSMLHEPALAALLLYVSLQYAWNILFSPFADRFPYLMFLIPVLVLNTEYFMDTSYDED